MKGWLLGNQFLRETRFCALYDRLLSAAERRNVALCYKTNAEVLANFPKLLESEHPDFVIFWDKDEVLAWMLESKGLRLFNSARAITDCDNKALTYARLLAAGIPTPQTIPVPVTYERVGYTDFTFLEHVGEILGFPMIVKECYGSFGAQVYLVHDLSECRKLLSEKAGTPMLFQKFLSHTAGRDVRIYMVGGEMAAAIERKNPSDFRANVAAGGQAAAYRPNTQEAAIARAACMCLHLDFGGVDLLWDERGRPLVCEVNSNAHFQGIADATGVHVEEWILDWILRAVKTGKTV